MFLPIKVIIWAFCLRFGDGGTERRPWILGTGMAIVFIILDLILEEFGIIEGLTLFVAYLIGANLFMNLRYRLDGIMASLILALVGTAVMFVGIPWLMMTLFDDGAAG